jgi:hypothetical protein
MRIVWIVYFSMAVLALAGQVPQFTVGGVVQDFVTGSPVARARVTLVSVADDKRSWALTTSGDGRFSFRAAQGMYQLLVQRHGHNAQGLSQGLESYYSSGLVVGPEQDTSHIVFRSIACAALSGRITDERGEPVENALVQLYSSHVLGGRRQIALRSYMYANDMREYRFAHLPGGRYYLGVGGTPWYSQPRLPAGLAGKTSGPVNAGFAAVYYPNAPEARKAAPVDVRAGDEATANVTLTSAPGHTIRVQYTGGDQGPVHMGLLGEGFPGIDFFYRIAEAYGEYVFTGVPPGHYRVRAMRQQDGRTLLATKGVDVSSDDESVELVMRDLAPLTGQVRMSADMGSAAQIIVMLRDGETGRSFSRGVNADGSFSFPGILAGKYQALIYRPEDYWASQVVADGTESHGGVIEVTDDHAPRLTIVASKGVAQLKGKVLRAGQPVMGAQVVLTPPGRPGDLNDSYADQSNSDGTFEIPNVHPGEYLLLAFMDPEVEYADPSVLRTFLKQAKLLHIQAKQAYNEDVNVQ